MRPVYSGALKRPPIAALACSSPVSRQPAGTHRPQVPRLATRTSSTPSTGALASGQAAVGEVRAVTAPEATPRLSPARPAASRHTPSLAATPTRRSVRPSCCVPYSSVTLRSPLARSTTASTRTDGAPCASSRPWIARSPPQPKSGWTARSSGAIGNGSMVAEASRRAPLPRASLACQATWLQRSGGAERLGAARLEAGAWRAAAPEIAAAQRLRAQPGAGRRRQALREQLVHRAAPARGAFAADIDQAAFEAGDDDAAARARRGRRRRRDGPGGGRRSGRRRRRRALASRSRRPIRAARRSIRSAARPCAPVPCRSARRAPVRSPGRRGRRHRARACRSSARRRRCRGAIGLRRAARPAARDAAPRPAARRRCAGRASDLRSGRSPSACRPRNGALAAPLRGACSSGARRASWAASMLTCHASCAGLAASCPWAWSRLPAASSSTRRAGVAVAVGVARLALQRHAGEQAVGQRQRRLAARRREQLQRRPGARDRQVELELALHVQAIDAAREQRVGFARPPRRRIEIDERGLARGMPGRIGAGPAQPAGERGARRAEAGFGRAQQNLARAAARLEADPGDLRRAPRQAAIGEPAGEVGAQLDPCALGERRRGEAGADGAELAVDRGLGRAGIERRRPELVRARARRSSDRRSSGRCPRSCRRRAGSSRARRRAAAPRSSPDRRGGHAARRPAVAPAAGPRSSGRRGRCADRAPPAPAGRGRWSSPSPGRSGSSPARRWRRRKGRAPRSTPAARRAARRRTAARPPSHRATARPGPSPGRPARLPRPRARQAGRSRLRSPATPAWFRPRPR